jgi:hypothetical protein
MIEHYREKVHKRLAEMDNLSHLSNRDKMVDKTIKSLCVQISTEPMIRCLLCVGEILT